MDLKFFYIVELNLKHPLISKFTLSKEFEGQSWLALHSQSYDTDKHCINNLKEFMKSKTKEFNSDGKKVACTYAENPYLSCAPEEIQTLETDFDDNALVSMDIKDIKGEWLIKSAVLLFKSDKDSNPRRFH